MKSIEERVQNAGNDLTLIIAGYANPDDVVGNEELHEALSAAAERAHEELYWLTLLPTEVLNTEAPTTDDQDAAR